MDKFTKIALIGSALAAGFYFIAKASGLKAFYDTLSISPKLDGGIKRISVKDGNINIPIAVDFENRTDEECTVGVSSLFLYYNGREIATLKPNENKTLIKKNSISTLPNLIVQIPIVKLVQVAGAVISLYITTGNYNEIIKMLSAKFTVILNDRAAFPVEAKLGETIEYSLSGIGAGVGSLGLIASKTRKLKPFSDYEALIPAKSELLHRDLIVIPNGTTKDTLALMKKVAVNNVEDTEILAQTLKRNTLPHTIQSVFDFVYNYIQYVPDSNTQEQVRRPLRTLWDRKGDCDCFATLIGSIFTNLGITYKFRIADYGRGWQHVYVIVPSINGYYVCDPVLDSCFTEKKPTKYLDF